MTGATHGAAHGLTAQTPVATPEAMSLWVRMLAVLLVVSTGGAFQVLDVALDSVEDCGDEEEGCDCSTCLLSCVCFQR